MLILDAICLAYLLFVGMNLMGQCFGCDDSVLLFYRNVLTH